MWIKNIAKALRFKRENAYVKCAVCGAKAKLHAMNVKNNIEVYKCETCGSQMLYKYTAEGLTISVWDNLHNEQMRMFYDWDAVMSKLEKTMPVIFERGDKV